MEAKVEFLRKGLCGDIWGLINHDGQVVRQFTAKTAKEAFEFFKDQSDSLKLDDEIYFISCEGETVAL